LGNADAKVASGIPILEASGRREVKMWRLSGLLLISSLILLGCSKSDKSTQSKPPAEPNYFPTSVGSHWIYEDEEGDSMLIESVANGTYRSLPVTIMKKTYQPPLDDNPVLYDTLFVWETKNQVTIFEKEVWMYLDSTIYHIFEDSVGQTILNYPLEVGKKWSYYDNEDWEIHVEVLSKETVSTPAGIFEDCYRIFYYWELDRDRHYRWFAPGVGMVKIYDPWNTYTYTLKDYKIK